LIAAAHIANIHHELLDKYQGITLKILILILTLSRQLVILYVNNIIFFEDKRLCMQDILCRGSARSAAVA
jgi:hypothetical protein